MAFHVPFEHRNNNQARVPIGFDTPAPYRTRPKFNWWGFNGLWMSIMCFFTAGALSIIPLTISVIGLRRRPRKMAAAGTILSLAGVALFSSLVIGGLVTESNRHHNRIMARQNRVVAKQVNETQTRIDVAIEKLTDYRDNHEGDLPGDIEANEMLFENLDAWELSLRYESTNEGGAVRSAGPDKDFDTRDDIVKPISGKSSETEVLLPLD